MLRPSTWKLGICLNPRFVFSEGFFSVYSFLVGAVFIGFESCFGEHYSLLAAIHVIRWLSAWLVVLRWRWLLLLFGSSGATTTMFV